MIHLFITLCFIYICTLATATSAEIPLSPYPAELSQSEGSYLLPRECTVSGELGGIHLETLPYLELKAAKDAHSHISLIKNKAFPKAESYALQITPEGIRIASSSSTGLYRGLQTLSQLFLLHQDSTAAITAELPALTIKDAPQYSWRGFMLDVSRHFAEVDEIKDYLDAMAAHKMNRFHWHLTDSPGWRIEIKKYPKLTSIGAIGNHADPEAAPKFYSQEQIKEIVEYAKRRKITIIPEIDMPGHAAAAVRAYPEFSGGGSAKHPDFTFNPACPKTEQFLLDILKEVAELFPESPIIHYGGDESHFGWDKWNNLKEVQQLKAKYGYTSRKQVEHHFNRKMAAHINELGYQTGGWDEVSRANLPPAKSLLFWWRHDKENELQHVLKKNYKVVLCPRIPCYLDFVQDPSHKVGRRWGGKFCRLNDVYQFPSKLKTIEGYAAQIVGIQACLWTEVGMTRKRREFLAYPRLQAIAEAAWTAPEQRNFDRFSRYLTSYLPTLEAQNITFASPDTPRLEVLNDGTSITR